MSFMVKPPEIVLISIHAPREGGDPSENFLLDCPHLFQSTPPARGATTSVLHKKVSADISIHAPREGGDDNGQQISDNAAGFQSTPPARGATRRRDHFQDP